MCRHARHIHSRAVTRTNVSYEHTYTMIGVSSETRDYVTKNGWLADCLCFSSMCVPHTIFNACTPHYCASHFNVCTPARTIVLHTSMCVPPHYCDTHLKEQPPLNPSHIRWLWLKPFQHLGLHNRPSDWSTKCMTECA